MPDGLTTRSFSRFPLSHPSVSGSSTSTPWTTNEGEAPNSRCGGSCPTASPLALPLSHPLFPVPLPLHLGLPMRGGAEQSVRWLMPDGLTTLLFPVPTFSPSTPWTTNEGEAPNSRCGGSCPTASLLALRFPVPTFSPPCFRFLYLYTLDYLLSELYALVSDLGPNTTFGAELKSCLPSGRRVCVPLGVRGIRQD